VQEALDGLMQGRTTVMIATCVNGASAPTGIAVLEAGRSLRWHTRRAAGARRLYARTDEASFGERKSEEGDVEMGCVPDAMRVGPRNSISTKPHRFPWWPRRVC